MPIAKKFDTRATRAISRCKFVDCMSYEIQK